MGLRHFESRLKATRENYILSCVMKFTGSPLRRSGTPFTMLRLGRSRLKSDMTTNSSGCVYGTMERASIRRFCRGRDAEGHYGLPGMRERGNLIGGKLVIWSEVGAGTEVELRIPAAVAYATAARRFGLSDLMTRK